MTVTPLTPTEARTRRLDELLDLRRKIDAEIARERAFLARLVELRKHAAAQIILDRDTWTDRIIALVADAYGVTEAAISAPDRGVDATHARQVVAWMLRQRGFSYPEIGRVIGRDHTTAMHAVKRVEADPELRVAAGASYAQLEAVAS